MLVFDGPQQFHIEAAARPRHGYDRVVIRLAYVDISARNQANTVVSSLAAQPSPGATGYSTTSTVWS